MSIERFVQKNSQKERNTETVSLRLPSTLLGLIDELAYSINVNRQDLLYEFVSEGFQTAAKAYEKEAANAEDICLVDDVENEKVRYYVLNTNYNNNEGDHKDMLEKGIAAAFCDPWKYKIDRIKKGDVVFLYQSGIGVVAYGKASGNLEVDGEKHWQKLDSFQRVVPFPAREIKRVIKSNLVFLQTMFKIPVEFGLLIEENLVNRG